MRQDTTSSRAGKKIFIQEFLPYGLEFLPSYTQDTFSVATSEGNGQWRFSSCCNWNHKLWLGSRARRSCNIIDIKVLSISSCMAIMLDLSWMQSGYNSRCDSFFIEKGWITNRLCLNVNDFYWRIGTLKFKKKLLNWRTWKYWIDTWKWTGL